MNDTEQAREFIENALNGLEKSVKEKNNGMISKSRDEFTTLITEYSPIIGTKSVYNYLNNYKEIIKKGDYLR
ncbi:MAG: hypothetical protein AABX80_00395 [Nanoarchaeota archaeon]